MSNKYSQPKQAGLRAMHLYESGIRQAVEKAHKGEYLIINLASGEYVVAKEWVAASDDAERRFRNAPRFLIRVGYPAAVRIGARA